MIGTIAGAVALVATGVGAFAAAGSALAGTAGSIATYAGLAAGVANIGSGLLYKPPPARGSVAQIMIAPDAPTPYVMGEGLVGGVLRYQRSYGATLNKVPNPYRFMAVVYSGAGPVESITPYVDQSAVSSWYSGFLYTDTQLGACPEPDALAPQWAGAPGWGAGSKLSGKAAIGWSLKFDKDGKRFASGVPQLGAYGRWVKVYDPRLDSSRPGGLGPCRLGIEATYVWSENPALHAGTYAFGRFQNGKRIMGIGLAADAVDWGNVAAWANVCEDNGWRLFGAVYEPGDRFQNLRDICAAGSAEPILGSDGLRFHYDAPRVALDTITAADLVEDQDHEVTAMATWAQRVNTVFPKYRSAAHNWEMIPAAAVQVPTYLAEDGEVKQVEWPFNLVKDADQAAQLARYRLENSRELQPIVLRCTQRVSVYRPGDCLTLDLAAQLGLSGKAVVLKREISPSNMSVTLTLIGETEGKHAFALGETVIPPASPALSQTGQQRDELGYIVSPVPEDPSATNGATVGVNLRLTDDNIPNQAQVITAEGTAAAIAGQGYFATQNFADWATRISGLGKPQDNATWGAISGVNLRNNADTAYLGDLDIITAAGTAAAIAGQGPGATAVAGAVMNYAVGLGQNVLTNSAFENGSYGWEPGWDNYASFTPEHGVGLPGYSGALSTAYTRVIGTPPAGVFDSYTPSGGNPKRWWLPVSGGDRVFASALVAYHRLAYAPDLKVGWYDASGVYLTESVVATGGRNGGAVNGEPANFDRVGGFVLAPVNARYARLWIRGATDGGQTEPYLFYTQMMLCRVPADQSAWPVYHDGGADLFANVTGENTAAAISGQGPLATAPSASPYVNANISIGANGALIGAGGGSVTIGGLGYLGDLDATRGARVGLNLRNSADTAYLGDADVVTAAGTAAALAGQSAWATYSGLVPSNVAGQVQHLQTDGNIQSLHVYKPGVALLSDVWPAEAGANVTESRTAAAINGQGPFATTPLPVSRLTMIKPNLFPYPFGVDDGRNAAQIGWSNAGAEAGFSEFGMGRNAYFDGGYYQTYRSSGAAATLYPYYDMAWDGGSAVVSVGLNGHCTNGTFNPYVEFMNAAKNAVLGYAGLAYNSATERYEANGATAPVGTAFIRVVVSGIFSATSGTYQDIVCWGIKIERGPNATPLMDTPRQRVSGDQIEWATGGKLNALRPAEFGSNVTENRTAAAIAGQGAGATANTLAQLDATAAAQLTTAYNGGVQSAAYGETIKRKIGPGGTLALSALVNCAAGGVSGSIRARIESRPYGGSWSTVATGAGSSTGPGEPGGDSTSGTFTNSTGVEQVFEFRVIEVRTPSGAGGAILASQSYVTG